MPVLGGKADLARGIRFPGGMELQTVTFRYKRGFRHECICHDDVYR